MNPKEFAAKIRAKYPGEYDHVSDEDLTNKVIAKYPEYKEHVQMRPDFAANPPGMPPTRTNMHEVPLVGGQYETPGMPGAGEGANLAEALGGYSEDVARPIGGGVKDIAHGDVARGAHKIIGGVGTALSPAIVPAAVVAPGATALALGGGALGGKLAEYGAGALGANPDQAALAGDIGNIAGGYGAVKGAGIVGDLARGNPMKNITEALHVPAKSPKMQAAIKDVEGAAPYLSGGKPTQADIQAKLPTAKAEVWEPYNKAVEFLKDKAVKGPDGPTTVGELEKERLKVSAEQQAGRKVRPTDQQTAVQAQKAQADLADRYKNITNILDDELRTTGIDPEAIRRVHGNLKGVERNISGKSTIAEPNAPYGIQKMLPKPKIFGLKGGWSPIEGARDIAAGRPLWSGKPSDVAMGDLFRTPTAKPDLGEFVKPVSGGSGIAEPLERRQYVRPIMTGEPGEPTRPQPAAEPAPYERRTPEQTKADIQAIDPGMAQMEANIRGQARSMEQRYPVGNYPPTLQPYGKGLVAPPEENAPDSFYRKYGQR